MSRAPRAAGAMHSKAITQDIPQLKKLSTRDWEAWAMSNAAKDIESSKNLLRNLTHDFETVKHEIDKLQASSLKKDTIMN